MTQVPANPATQTPTTSPPNPSGASDAMHAPSSAQEFDGAADPEAPGLSETERQLRRQKVVHAMLARAKREAQSGNYEEAIRILERAENIDPNDPVVQEALRRVRRAWQTEQQVLRRRK